MSCITIDFCNLLQSDNRVRLAPALIIFGAKSHRSLSTSPKDMLTKENELVDNSVENQ